MLNALFEHKQHRHYHQSHMMMPGFPATRLGHKTIKNNRALEAAFQRAGLDDVSSHNLRKTFATRLLNRGAAITDVQH